MTGRGIPMTQSVFSRSDLFPAAAPVVVLPAGEAALLVRIAEVAVEYSISHNYDKRKELFRLAKEWRKWSRDNR